MDRRSLLQSLIGLFSFAPFVRKSLPANSLIRYRTYQIEGMLKGPIEPIPFESLIDDPNELIYVGPTMQAWPAKRFESCDPLAVSQNLWHERLEVFSKLRVRWEHREHVYEIARRIAMSFANTVSWHTYLEPHCGKDFESYADISVLVKSSSIKSLPRRES